jgi:hypothetical protein
MSVPKKLIQKIKIKFLTTKFILLALFLLLTTSVFGYEAVKLYQFNKHIIQAKEEKESEDYQKASETFQKAKNVLSATFFLEPLKKEELEEIDNEIEEIKKLAEEKVKSVTMNDSPTATLSPTPVFTATPLQSKSLSLSPTSVPTTNTPTGIDWEQFNRELNEKLKEVRDVGDNNSNEPPEPTISIEQQKATKIISISDSLGNTHEMDCKWSNTHYECSPKEQKEPVVSIKTTPQLTFTINAQDPNNRPLVYNFNAREGCDGGPGYFVPWLSTNTCTITLKTDELGLRTFSFDIKNDDNYGSVGLDAHTQLNYRILE